jgi:hypothetical protein
MPALREQMRRMSIIYREIRDHGPINCKQLLSKVNRSIDRPVCKSSIEKDLFKLQMDFDVELNSSKFGYTLSEEIDFKESVIQYFNIDI